MKGSRLAALWSISLGKILLRGSTERKRVEEKLKATTDDMVMRANNLR